MQTTFRQPFDVLSLATSACRKQKAAGVASSGLVSDRQSYLKAAF
jgi:hypothetical protein